MTIIETSAPRARVSGLRPGRVADGLQETLFKLRRALDDTDEDHLMPVIQAAIRGIPLTGYCNGRRVTLRMVEGWSVVRMGAESLVEDAFDAARYFYLLVGWQTASMIAEEAMRVGLFLPDSWWHEDPAVAVPDLPPFADEGEGVPSWREVARG